MHVIGGTGERKRKERINKEITWYGIGRVQHDRLSGHARIPTYRPHILGEFEGSWTIQTYENDCGRPVGWHVFFSVLSGPYPGCLSGQNALIVAVGIYCPLIVLPFLKSKRTRIGNNGMTSTVQIGWLHSENCQRGSSYRELVFKIQISTMIFLNNTYTHVYYVCAKFDNTILSHVAYSKKTNTYFQNGPFIFFVGPDIFIAYKPQYF